MEQSTLTTHESKPLHVAIIMDGNGRWATSRGLPRVVGHRAGAQAVRRVVQAAGRLGVGTLTLYALSSDNWRRPPSEVAVLLRLLHEYLCGETENARTHGVRIRLVGRRDRLPPDLLTTIGLAEAATDGCRGLELRIAVDYSSRDAIVRAARRFDAQDENGDGREAFARLLAQVDGTDAVSPDVDLLIRSGGEQRLSDFLLWECAYAELVFTPRMWPEFEASDLEEAIREFKKRERRFGRIPHAAAG